MAKVQVGAAEPTSKLFWNRYQAAFLQALAARTPSGRRQFNRLSLFAGRRGGKTKIGGVAAVSQMVPGSLGWACAPSYPELQDYVLPAVLNLIPREWIAEWSASRLELTLINGARCAFRSLDDPNRGRGPGLDWLWIDEARKVQLLAWDTLMPALASNRGTAWFTTTPNSYDWCYKRLWKPAQEGVPGFWACRYWTVDNPSIDPAEIEQNRREMDPNFFAQEYQADFITFTGAIYNGRTLDPQILQPNDPRIRELFPEWPRIDASRVAYVGIDPGADHPFAAVLLVSSDRGLVQVGEYLERNKSAFEHKRGIYQMLSRWNPDRPFSPDRWAIDRSQKQMAIELAQSPLAINCTAAENDVRAGINRVQAWLQTNQLWILAGENPRTVEQLRGYRWDETANASGEYRREQPMKIEDDLPDALRYALMLWPEIPQLEQSSLSRPGLENFNDEQRWSIDRMNRIDRRERGELPPEDEDESGLAAVSRRYYDEDDDAPAGVGEMFS